MSEAIKAGIGTDGIRLTGEEVRLLIKLLEYHNDCGPRGEGWQSDELSALVQKLKNTEEKQS